MRNRWSCLPTAFARALGISLDEMIERIGHDGSRIVWPDLPEPGCRRGFHIQECIEVARLMGMSVMPVELYPRHAPTLDVEPITVLYADNVLRFNDFIKSTKGVLTGSTQRYEHAVAYDHGSYDGGPNFIPTCAWSIHEIQP